MRPRRSSDAAVHGGGAHTGAGVAARLDAINEFDREPVSDDRLHGPGTFVAMYAGEHQAGTESVIGPLFVAHGVTAGDLFGGPLGTSRPMSSRRRPPA